jgi:Glycosyl hydrolase-like 10/Carboxypeptidase regulatory-like domain
VQMGYNPASLARYRRRFAIPEDAEPPARTDPRWQQWRRDQVTALVRRVYLDCLAVKPSLKITASVIGWGAGPADDRSWRGTSAYGNVFQDWVAWLEEGIVDVAMPMNYDDEANPEQQAWFDRWLAWEKTRQGKRHVAAGIGLFLNKPEAGLAQIRRALAPGPRGEQLAGVALYSYAVTNAPPKGSEVPATPNAQFYAWLAGAGTAGDQKPPEGDPLFAAPAVPPPMSWKLSPRALVRGTATLAGQPLDGATVRLEGPAGAALTLQTDGNGYFGAPDLVPGTYTATLQYQGAVVIQTAVDLPGGRVTTLDLAG